MTRVLGITGYKQAGKDTFCSAMMLRFKNVVRLAIADEIKRELAKFLDITVEQIEAFKEPHYRRPLQDLGSARRKTDKNYWLNSLCLNIEAALAAGNSVVVPDIRLPVEGETIREKFGATVIRLHRVTQGPIDNHETELLVDSVKVDETFTFGSPEEVRANAFNFGCFLGWRKS